VGVRHEALAVRKHSRSGRPSDIYAYHGIDADAIVEMAGKILAETAVEKVVVSERTLNETFSSEHSPLRWQDLWAHSRFSQQQKH
jgi:pyruvate dehydrogenase E1 component